MKNERISLYPSRTRRLNQATAMRFFPGFWKNSTSQLADLTTKNLGISSHHAWENIALGLIRNARVAALAASSVNVCRSAPAMGGLREIRLPETPEGWDIFARQQFIAVYWCSGFMWL